MATIANLMIKIGADTDSAMKDIGSFSGKVSKGLNKAILPAVGILGGLAVAGKKAADAASNLGESQNAVNVVFGKGSKTISAFAKVADKEAGLSMRQLNELVTPIGAAMINMGDSADVAATKSVNLAKRAADMASVFNVDVSEALGAIQAGLRGEADPLERFGVGLSDVAVRAQAVEMGLAKTTKEVTDADKAQARYGLILEQTSKLQGDFVNTSDGAANAARVNAAAQENLKAKIGTGLLPVVETYQKLLGKLTGLMAENTGATKIAVGVVAGLAGVLLVMAGTLKVVGLVKDFTIAIKAMNLALLANPIVLIIAGLVLLGAGLVIAYKKSETFRDVVNGVFNAVKGVVLGVVSFILGAIDKFLGGIEGVLRAASKLPFVGDKFKGLADSVAGARDRVRDLQTSINSLKSKEITITTNLRTYGSTAADASLGVIGRRAHGGPVMGGLPYLVGERGPEIFTPHVGGNIIPNNALSPSGSGSPALHVENLTVNDPVDVDLLASRVAARLALR